jgi:transcriptional regulator with XRE-family HTH domain
MKIDGTKIASLRRERNMTQGQLADKVGVTRQAISMIELGTTRQPLGVTLYSLAAILEVPVDELLEPDGEAVA